MFVGQRIKTHIWGVRNVRQHQKGVRTKSVIRGKVFVVSLGVEYNNLHLVPKLSLAVDPQ